MSKFTVYPAENQNQGVKTVFDQLIADAKEAYATGKVRPTRGVYSTRDGRACIIAAAWKLHHEYRETTGPTYMGHWALVHYKLPRNPTQGFIHGWDGSVPQDGGDGYLEGYKAGQNAAAAIIG